MRLLTVGNMYPPLHEGGYEVVWQEAVEHMRGGGHEVEVLTTDHRAKEPRPPEPGVHRELRWYWRDHDFPRMSAAERMGIERHNAGVLDRVLTDLKPDVVAWWSMGGMSMGMIERARRKDAPGIGVVCDDWMLYGPKTDGWMRLWRSPWLPARLAARLIGLPTRVDLGALGACLFPSEAVREPARSRWGLADTEVCHQGVSDDLFAAAEPRPWRWRLLYVGRIDSRKGIELAVKALADLPQKATLTVAGSGDARHRVELQELAADLGVADRLTETQLPRHELRDLYAASDAVVFPVRWREPWGLVPLEAMAVGRPVVATGLGGSGEYLRDGENCLIFDPEAGPSALAARVRELADDEGLRKQLRQGGAATAGRFGADDFSRAFAELAERAASGRP
jgi:glycosyltransferase involved in cell wall biosynthesis